MPNFCLCSCLCVIDRAPHCSLIHVSTYSLKDSSALGGHLTKLQGLGNVRGLLFLFTAWKLVHLQYRNLELLTSAIDRSAGQAVNPEVSKRLLCLFTLLYHM
uniref:Uncharacterized protein n=1 Tax=Anguilla anguilla TaxID=7936 RepID=A0A0E9PJK1_ANGAN